MSLWRVAFDHYPACDDTFMEAVRLLSEETSLPRVVVAAQVAWVYETGIRDVVDSAPNTPKPE